MTQSELQRANQQKKQIDDAFQKINKSNSKSDNRKPKIVEMEEEPELTFENKQRLETPSQVFHKHYLDTSNNNSVIDNSSGKSSVKQSTNVEQLDA